MAGQLKNISVAVLLVILAFGSEIKAQNGVPCHASFFSFTPRHNLNIPSFMGTWYVHEMAGSDIGNFPPPDFNCYTHTMSLLNESDISQIHSVDNYINSTDGTTTVFQADSVVNATRSPLSSMWYMTGEDGVTAQVIILFVDLEFSEWTVVYSCSHMGPEEYRYEVLMAMTRSPEITPQLRSYLKALMVGQGFRIGDHQPIDHTRCPI